MITRKDIQTVITETLPYAKEVFITKIMNLIEQEREQYQELVDAAVAWRNRFDDRFGEEPESEWLKEIYKATEPFLPPQSIADELDALADEYRLDNLKELANKYRKLHGEGRDEIT